MAYTTFAEPTNKVAATAGKDYLIYVNTGTTEANPTWTLVGGQRSGTFPARLMKSTHRIRQAVGGNPPFRDFVVGLSTLKACI